MYQSLWTGQGAFHGSGGNRNKQRAMTAVVSFLEAPARAGIASTISFPVIFREPPSRIAFLLNRSCRKSNYIVPYICDFFYCFCFLVLFVGWIRLFSKEKWDDISCTQKRPTGLYRRISHNIIISHKEQVGQHIQNRNEKFVRKHKNECQNSYILPIVFLRKICYSISAKRKRWFQWPKHSLPCIQAGRKARAPEDDITPDRQAASVGRFIALRCLYRERRRFGEHSMVPPNKEREVQEKMLDIKSEG